MIPRDVASEYRFVLLFTQMKIWKEKIKKCLRNEAFVQGSVEAFIMLALSLVVNFYSGLYATERASSPVTDLILSNTPIFDLDGIFVWGAIALWAFTILMLFREPRKIPFAFKSIALFVVVRSIFISLTHIGPFPTGLPADPGSVISNSKILFDLFYGKDLFFSGHTGLPFLFALLFWENTILRNIFIVASVFFGAIVLLAHFHYSIDVLAAFFITYSIYRLSEIFFRLDKEMAVN